MKEKMILIVKALIARIFLKKKINHNAWVFSSTENKKYNYNSKYLFEYVKENLGAQITPYYVINDKKERERLQSVYGKQYFIETRTIKGIRHVLNCGVWFTSAGLPIYGTSLKKEHLIVNLWHGVPLKKIALLDPNLNRIARIFFRSFFSKNYSHIVTTSNRLKQIMMKSFAVPEAVIKVWGQPRNDGIFQKKDRKQILSRLYNKLPNYEKAILYAPTFRDKSKTILFPFKDFSIEEANLFLEKNQCILFIRTHVNDKSEITLKHHPRIFFMNSDIVDDVTDVLNIFDLLITDYCSIYIDFLLTRHPILFLPYDQEEYMKDRGFNFEYDKVSPGPKPQDKQQFFMEAQKLLDNPKYYLEERIKLNQYFNEIQEICSPKICQLIMEEKG